MQADTAAVLRRALEFAGRLAGEAEIARAVKFADFAQLRQQEQDKGFREAPRPHAGGEFFRRGAAGGWREELTPEQAVRIEADHAGMMRRLGYNVSPALARAG
jgi:aryl sulfotransferase